MKLSIKLPITKLGKISLALIALTFMAWLFTNNAENCLSRDFVEKAPVALCWVTPLSYESIIEYSQLLYLGLLGLAITCSSVTICRLRIRHSSATSAENKKTAWFLAALSGLLLVFIVTMFTVWQRTTYNNNNYALNATATIVVKVGVPLWVAVTAAAISYKLI